MVWRGSPLELPSDGFWLREYPQRSSDGWGPVEFTLLPWTDEADGAEEPLASWTIELPSGFHYDSRDQRGVKNAAELTANTSAVLFAAAFSDTEDAASTQEMQLPAAEGTPESGGAGANAGGVGCGDPGAAAAGILRACPGRDGFHSDQKGPLLKRGAALLQAKNVKNDSGAEGQVEPGAGITGKHHQAAAGECDGGVVPQHGGGYHLALGVIDPEAAGARLYVRTWFFRRRNPHGTSGHSRFPGWWNRTSRPR